MENFLCSVSSVTLGTHCSVWAAPLKSYVRAAELHRLQKKKKTYLLLVPQAFKFVCVCKQKQVCIPLEDIPLSLLTVLTSDLKKLFVSLSSTYIQNSRPLRAVMMKPRVYTSHGSKRVQLSKTYYYPSTYQPDYFRSFTDCGTGCFSVSGYGAFQWWRLWHCLGQETNPVPGFVLSNPPQKAASISWSCCLLS